MDITFYMHYFDAKKLYGKKIMDVNNLEADFANFVKYVKNMPKDKKTKDFKKDKIAIYLNDYFYHEDERILVIDFISARYNKIRRVVNTLNWAEQNEKMKAKTDGDEESTSIAIKFISDKEAYCMSESNSDGVGFSRIKEYLNEYIREYHENKLKDLIRYRIETNNMISQDFIKALTHANRIKGVRLVIDQKDLNVSENKEFAKRDDINKDVEIVFKPAGKGCGIHQNTVKEFYKIYSDKKKIIKKIYVDAKGDDGNPLRFDTEQMKDKHIIDINERYNGEVELDNLHKEMVNTIKKYE